jgi:hypothetical protein
MADCRTLNEIQWPRLQKKKKKKKRAIPQQCQVILYSPITENEFCDGFEKGSGQTCIQQTRLKTNKGWLLRQRLKDDLDPKKHKEKQKRADYLDKDSKTDLDPKKQKLKANKSFHIMGLFENRVVGALWMGSYCSAYRC